MILASIWLRGTRAVGCLRPARRAAAESLRHVALQYPIRSRRSCGAASQTPPALRVFERRRFCAPPRGCSLALLPICAYRRKRLIHPVLDCSPCWATPGSEVDENGARNRQRFLSFLQQGVMAGSVTGDKGSGGIGSGPPTTGEGARHPSVSMHASTCILAHVHAHIHPHIYEHTIHSSTNAHPQERAAVYL